MGAGSLRWDVIVRTRIETNPVTYANAACFAAIATAFAGPETRQSGTTKGQVTYTLTFRDEVSVTARDLIQWGNKELFVQSVRMVSPGYIEVLATENQ
jgi:hypothetical protein